MIELAGNLIIRDGKILVIKKSDQEHWKVPGGKVEDGESPTDAAVRKTNEEIGVEVELRKPFYSGEFQHDDQLFLWHCYLAEIVDGEPEVQEDKCEELAWVEPKELDEMELAPNLDMILPALRKMG